MPGEDNAPSAKTLESYGHHDPERNVGNANAVHAGQDPVPNRTIVIKHVARIDGGASDVSEAQDVQDED